MNIIIAGGSGFIGSHLIAHFRKNPSHKLAVIGRNKAKLQSQFGETIQCWDWHEVRHMGKAILTPCHVLINLTGANIGDRPWTTSRRSHILQSRVESTQTLSAICASLGSQSPRLLNASAMGIYGLQASRETGLPEPFHENSHFNRAEAPDFLSKVGRSWELATQAAEDAHIPVVKLRFGVVLDGKGGALPKMVLPYYFFLGGKIGSGHQPFSWVALPDVIGVIQFLLDHPEITGPVNVVAPQCVPQYEFAKTVGQVIHRPAWLSLPGVLLETALGDMAKELLLNGTHVIPKRLQALGYHFHHPHLRGALEGALLG